MFCSIAFKYFHSVQGCLLGGVNVYVLAVMFTLGSAAGIVRQVYDRDMSGVSVSTCSGVMSILKIAD